MRLTTAVPSQLAAALAERSRTEPAAYCRSMLSVRMTMVVASRFSARSSPLAQRSASPTELMRSGTTLRSSLPPVPASKVPAVVPSVTSQAPAERALSSRNS